MNIISGSGPLITYYIQDQSNLRNFDVGTLNGIVLPYETEQ